MSIIQPSRLPVLPYEPSTVRSRVERTEAYFLISPLGLHPAPTNCSFLARGSCSSQIYCDTTPSSIQNGGIQYDASAVIFEVTGKIRRDLCFLTTDGDRAHPDTGPAALSERADFASCWLEAPGDTARERAVWRRSLRQLKGIACRAGRDVCTDEFLRPADRQREHGVSVSDNRPAFLQVSWTPPASIGLGALPVFNARHEHIPLPTLERVPFDKRVRVRFVLQLATRPAIENRKGPVIGASIHYMHVLD